MRASDSAAWPEESRPPDTPTPDFYAPYTQELGLDLLRTVCGNNVKVTLAVLTHQRHLALIDAVGIDDDLERGRLAENFR
jgi:hypothetical protein